MIITAFLQGQSSLLEEFTVAKTLAKKRQIGRLGNELFDDNMLEFSMYCSKLSVMFNQ